MSNQGQVIQTGAKTFQRNGKLGQILPVGFLSIGAGCVSLAVLTAITPAPVAFLAQVARVLDRVGLDKGPLLMFGVLSTAMGFALSRLEKASSGDGAALQAANFAQSNAGSIELQGEILGSVQAELGSIRNEIATARREAKEEKNADGNGEASDPLFRLAASLDQLGAQIDKRIDKARREMMEAITGVASSMEVGAQQHEEAFKQSAGDVDSVRMDIADLRAQLTRVATDVASTKSVVAALKTPETQDAPAAGSEAGQKIEEAPAKDTAPASDASSAPSLPIELTDEAPAAKSEPSGPLPQENSASESDKQSEPQFEGFSFEADAESESQQEAQPEPPALGVNMQSLGFPEPPAPMPKPSEDLGLIDQMQDDTAKQAEETPPLFPDAFDQR